MITVTKNYNNTVIVTTRHAHDDITNITIDPIRETITASVGIWSTCNAQIERDTNEHRVVQLAGQYLYACERRTHEEIEADPTCNDGWDNYRGEPVTRAEKEAEIAEIAADLTGALLILDHETVVTQEPGFDTTGKATPVPAGFWSTWGRLNRTCRDVKCQFKIANRVWKALRDAVWLDVGRDTETRLATKV